MNRSGSSIKSFFKLLRILIATVYSSIRVIIQLKHENPNPIFFENCRNWGRRLLKIAEVDVEIIGYENVDKVESCVFVSNHSSFFDIPILLACIKKDFRIIYKKELEKLPFFGTGLNRSPFISINRGNPREAMKSILQAIEAIKSGDSVLVFPEGTRSETGKLQEFKRGAFVLAYKSNKPIIPVTVLGSYDIIPPGIRRIRGGRVKLVIGESLSTKDYSEKELSDKIHGIMSKNIEKYQK